MRLHKWQQSNVPFPFLPMWVPLNLLASPRLLFEQKVPHWADLQRIILVEATWGQETTHSGSPRSREAWGLGFKLPLCQPPHQHFRGTIPTIDARQNKATSPIFLSLPFSTHSALLPVSLIMEMCSSVTRKAAPTVLGAEHFHHSSCCHQTQSQAPHLFWLTLKNPFRHPLEQNGAREQSQAVEEKQSKVATDYLSAKTEGER